MKKANVVRVVLVVAAALALGWLPQPTLAQHGGGGHGGGGGGGFHGGGGGGFHGGGGSAFHGGGNFTGGVHSGYGGGHYAGGYRGGYYGGRGGYYGGRGGYYGGRGYGWGGRGWGRGYGYGWGGWGWGFGYGWPYWGWGYPYGYYGYYPDYYAPGYYYSYPGYGPSDDPGAYPDPDNGGDNPAPADPNARPAPNQNGPARSWRPPVPGGAGNANYGQNNIADNTPRGAVLSVDRIDATPSNHRAAPSVTDPAAMQLAASRRSSAQKDAPLRPEMQRALQRLREMPPFAREREIETGSYRGFSAEEKQILRDAV